MTTVEIGQRLESERLRLSRTAVEIYDDPRVSIAQTTYKNYETGKRDMPVTLLATLWGIGFDAMYILTGTRIEDVAADVLTQYHQRLIVLPEIMDINNPADLLLTAMYHAEEALVQAGATAHEDYSYKDLAKIALGLLDSVK